MEFYADFNLMVSIIFGTLFWFAGYRMTLIIMGSIVSLAGIWGFWGHYNLPILLTAIAVTHIAIFAIPRGN